MSSAGSGESLSRLSVSKAESIDPSLQDSFAALVDRLRRMRPEDDVGLLRRAFEFAAEQHGSQTRRSGEPYLSHPLEVAHILADLRLDVTALCAALLHDIVEDTHIPISVVSDQFGSEVARLVEGVTKISRLELL